MTFASPSSLSQSGVKGMHPLAGRGAAPHIPNYKKELQKRNPTLTKKKEIRNENLCIFEGSVFDVVLS
jgi:hypothetical protein